MGESYLVPRIQEREHEFRLLAHMSAVLRTIAMEHHTDLFDEEYPVCSSNPAETPILPLPDIYGWSVCVSRGIGDEEKHKFFDELGLYLHDPVELFITPTCDDKGKIVNPELRDELQMWILVDDNGAIDQSNRQRLSYEQTIGLANDIETRIKPLFS